MATHGKAKEKKDRKKSMHCSEIVFLSTPFLLICSLDTLTTSDKFED